MKRFRIFFALMLVLAMAACERTAPIEPTAQPTSTGTLALSLADLTDQTLTAKAITASLNTSTATSAAAQGDDATPLPPISTSAEADAAAAQTDATATQTASPRPTATATNTLAPQEQAIQLMAGITFERFFTVQTGTPVGMVNWNRPEAGCNWMGIAGQIFDLNGDPEIGVVLEAGGSLGGESVLGLALTGLESAYGPGGYEIQLADRTIASQDQVWIQLKGNNGEPLSYPIYFQTYDSCEKNLILMNFVETSEIPPTPEIFHVFLPLVQGP